MKKIFIMCVLLSVSAFADFNNSLLFGNLDHISDGVNFNDGSVLVSGISNLLNIVLVALSTSFLYLIKQYTKKYHLNFLDSYIEKVVKKVEQKYINITQDFINDKYLYLYNKNPKLSYALTLIEEQLSNPFSKIFLYLNGITKDTINTIIESKVYDLKKNIL